MSCFQLNSLLCIHVPDTTSLQRDCSCTCSSGHSDELHSLNYSGWRTRPSSTSLGEWHILHRLGVHEMTEVPLPANTDSPTAHHHHLPHTHLRKPRLRSMYSMWWLHRTSSSMQALMALKYMVWLDSWSTSSWRKHWTTARTSTVNRLRTGHALRSSWLLPCLLQWARSGFGLKMKTIHP